MSHPRGSPEGIGEAEGLIAGSFKENTMESLILAQDER
jgi:hypothetical protein